MKKAKSTHVLTSREKGGQRLLVLFGVAILILFTLCSVYAVTQVPLSPAGWAMLVFFSGLLILILMHEENMFPALEWRKTPFAVVAWFFWWIFIAMIASFLITMNLGHFVMAVLFGLIALLSTGYVVTPEKKWGNFKEKVKDKTTRKVSKKVKSKLKRKKVGIKNPIKSNRKRRKQGY